MSEAYDQRQLVEPPDWQNLSRERPAMSTFVWQAQLFHEAKCRCGGKRISQGQAQISWHAQHFQKLDE